MLMSNITKYKRYNFLGTDVEALTYDDLYNMVDEWLKDKRSRSHHIAVINAYCSALAYKNSKISEIYNKADIVVPDGMPFVYWIRTFLNVPCDQFDASSVVTKLAEKSRNKNYTFYLLGGYPKITEKMKEKLEMMYPYINIVGYNCPPFRPLTKEEDQAICDEINRLKPDILCISLGTPKQDYWIDEHITKIRGSVFVPCGAIFDFFGDRIKRAPEFMTKMGIEWLYRLFSKDFKRLWHRYTVVNFIFLFKFFLQLTGMKVKKPNRIIRPEV